MKQTILSVILAAVALLSLTGCKAKSEPAQDTAQTYSEPDIEAEEDGGSTPGAAANGGADLLAALMIPADDTAADEADCHESATSADGKITYTAGFTLSSGGVALPVLQVTPHTLTSEDAEQVARALFGDGEFYEYTSELTKSELEAEIQAMSDFISDRDALVEFYDGDEEIADIIIEDHQQSITSLKTERDAAPESVAYVPCDWQFYPTSHYQEVDVEDDDTQSVLALVWMDGTPYSYSASNCDNGKYCQQVISAHIDSGRVMDVDMNRDRKVNESAALAKVNAILEQMDMGQWDVTYDIDEDWRGNQYMQVTAVPVYNGVKALFLPQPDIYEGNNPAGNYEYTEIFFTFDAGGLSEFYFTAPVDVVSVVNESVKTLPVGEIVDAFSRWMKQSDAVPYQEQIGDVAQVDAQISSAELGLARIPVSGSKTDFYLLPAYAFRGECTTRYGDGSTDEAWENTFAVINAVDGGVVSTRFAY